MSSRFARIRCSSTSIPSTTSIIAASARASLWVIFWGTAVTLPAILGYTIYSYRIFHGRAEDLSYD